MRVFTTVLFVSFLLMSYMTFAGEKANFSGKWSLNEEKSELGEGRRWMVSTKLSITQEENNLSIERRLTRRSGEEVDIIEKYTLDGKECENTLLESPKKSTVTWSEDGQSLTISSTIVFERNGNKIEINTVEILKLIEDANSLSIDYTSQSPRGERKRIYIYDKEKVTE